ncbi:MAG: cation diffusion facilitator family transporter [Rhodospirillales bacterium]|nr:cation diffusion facilitator family transporter [Rhodospirillales bacterium]
MSGLHAHDHQADIVLNPRMALVASRAAVTIVTILIVIKTLAYIQSGSASVLASLTDSVGDAAISLMSWFAVHLSLKPADKEHRHGHGKVEGLAALFQAAFLSGAAVFLFFEALERFTNPQAVVDHALAIAVMALSTVITLALVAIQRWALRQAPSLAVEADRAHYSMDILTNLATLGILLALSYGAPQWIDPLFALLMVVYFLFTAWEIGGKAMDMLLDRELPEDIRSKILATVREHPKIVSVHDLRTRASGMKIYIYFDIEVDPDYSLRKAHGVALDVERQLMREFSNAEIMIHVDPAGIPHDESRHRNVPDVHE